MNKSIYSLVLSDEIVREVDRLAYENGTSRSNMVNRILAESLSFTTPEKRMSEIFAEMERMFTATDTFKVLLQPSESMFSIRSALTYKYNPTVRYSVELNPNLMPDVGELRVSVRSQNTALQLYMLQFFKLWTGLEKQITGRGDSEYDRDKYVKRLYLNPDCQSSNQTIGQAISSYIRLFDRSLNYFFTNLNMPDWAEEQIKMNIKQYLADAPAIL